jgi:uncharacterized protein YcsI (UPF0317 family)
MGQGWGDVNCLAERKCGSPSARGARSSGARRRPDSGLEDLGRQDFGGPVAAEPGDVPVFSACGVTPQAALMASRPPFAITRTPECMKALLALQPVSDLSRPLSGR